MKINWEKTILWAIYLALLGVLLPHTAWAFGKFEPTDGEFVAWLAAFAFEAIIAAFTHKLARHIEQVPNHKDKIRRFRDRYLNAYSLGLSIALAVSFLANLAHAIEFGSSLRVFADRGSAFAFYALAFGGVLPATSLLFARVLSNVREAEQEESQALTEAKAALRELSKKLRDTEQRAQAAERRYEAIGDVVSKLFSERKEERILAVAETWPKLPQRAMAIIADCAPSYVSEVLNGSSE